MRYFITGVGLYVVEMLLTLTSVYKTNAYLTANFILLLYVCEGIFSFSRYMLVFQNFENLFILINQRVNMTEFY